MATMAVMPLYECHKKAWALKIREVISDLDGQGITLSFENPHFLPRSFHNLELEHKPVPMAGMYFVQYENGYFSFSPAKVFEEGYKLVG